MADRQGTSAKLVTFSLFVGHESDRYNIVFTFLVDEGVFALLDIN